MTRFIENIIRLLGEVGHSVINYYVGFIKNDFYAGIELWGLD